MTFTYRMTVTSTDGTSTEGACSDADVRRAVAAAARRGYQVEVKPDGGVNITREIPGSGYRDVTYKPARNAGSVTATMLADLRLIGTRPAAALQPETGRINAGYFGSIPPAASAALRSRGLVTVDGTTVTLSVAARAAMLAQDHHARAPWGHLLTPDQLAAFAAAL